MLLVLYRSSCSRQAFHRLSGLQGLPESRFEKLLLGLTQGVLLGQLNLLERWLIHGFLLGFEQATDELRVPLLVLGVLHTLHLQS